MTRAEIMGRLESLPFIEIFESREGWVVAYDTVNATDFTIRFQEFYRKEDLKERIHISGDIPRDLQPDLQNLTDYLWKVMDHNAFLTLEGLWFVQNDGEYGEVARFHECEDAILLPQYEAQGCMWFSRQVCIVDVGRIVQKNPHADTRQLRREVVVTALHELRHLMLDTNPTLPPEEYPLELGREFLVERYAQEICEDGQIVNIFI